jgi:DNA-directed RNA polymerase specialized sigma24 family protein
MTFEEFAAARLAAVLRFACVLTGDRALAEDVVQEVLIRAHARWRKIGRLDHPESYIRKMIVNEFISSKRRSWRFVPAGTDIADGCGSAVRPPRWRPPPRWPPSR